MEAEIGEMKEVKQKKEHKYSDETSVKTIFNHLTIIMVFCVVLPVLVQNFYNLNFTHPGR
jgi:hypothetical protein